MSSHKKELWVLGSLLGLCALIGCVVVVESGGGRSDQPDAEDLGPVATTQERMPLTDFEAIVLDDPELQVVVDTARWAEGAGEFTAAGRVVDQAGAELILGVMSMDIVGQEVVVVRHCQDGDCLSARQTEVGGDEEILWSTPDGPVPVRTVQVPYQLRLIDESDPDGTAVIAPMDVTASAARSIALLQVGSSQAVRGVSDAEKDGTSPTSRLPANRVFRVVSAFGKHWEVSFDGVVDTMRNAGFTDSHSDHHVNQTELDTYFTSLGRADVLAIFAHGDESQSRKRVVGMSTAKWYWLSLHYSENRMLEKLRDNPNGGPGLIFFAGCQTGDMLSQFDEAYRIVLGFSKKLHPGQSARAMQLFFEKFASGLTLGETLDATNGEYCGQHGFELLLNSKAYRDIKLQEIGDFDRPGCRDTCDSNRDGECDDGGTGATYASCDPGTDCFDCGPRDPNIEDVTPADCPVPTGAELRHETTSEGRTTDYYWLDNIGYVGPYLGWWDLAKTRKRVDLCYDSEGREHGWYRGWFENGSPSIEMQYNHGMKEGVRREWHYSQNGQLWKEDYYVNNLRNGVCRGWYENGQMEYESNYVDGKSNGVTKAWYSHGQLKSEIGYKDDVIHGIYKTWDEQGNLTGDCDVVDGEFMNCRV